MVVSRRVSIDGMDEVEVAQAQIVDVPSTFDGSVVLLDVRADDEWQRGHAPGAQHIPMGQVPTRNGYARVNISGGMPPAR
jgi:rhodanese-related sulfurtransferase